MTSNSTNDLNENKDRSNSIEEKYLKISIPTEKLLEKKRRNKRKSRLFSEKKKEISDEEVGQTEEANEIDKSNLDMDSAKVILSRTGNLFSENEFKNSDCRLSEFTLEHFSNLSVEDAKDDMGIKNNTSKATSSPTNVEVTSIRSILKELTACEESNRSKKLNYSEKFKNSTHNFNDAFPSKRFKI